MERSGAVAMGLSAINMYVDLNSGKNTVKDYVRLRPQRLDGDYTRGSGRDIARHVDSTVPPL